MQKIILPRDGQYGTVFAIVKTLSGTYVCPGWHPVPEGTTREQISFEADTTPIRQKEAAGEPENKRYAVSVAGSKPGKFYNVVFERGQWSCTCPSATFHRGDCKHVKVEKEKFEKSTK